MKKNVYRFDYVTKPTDTCTHTHTHIIVYRERSQNDLEKQLNTKEIYTEITLMFTWWASEGNFQRCVNPAV